MATFTDVDTANVASDFTATIDLGDGTTTPARSPEAPAASPSPRTHTYAASGSYPVTVTLTDDALGTATATVTSTANAADSIASIPTLGLSACSPWGSPWPPPGLWLLRRG